MTEKEKKRYVTNLLTGQKSLVGAKTTIETNLVTGERKRVKKKSLW